MRSSFTPAVTARHCTCPRYTGSVISFRGKCYDSATDPTLRQGGKSNAAAKQTNQPGLLCLKLLEPQGPVPLEADSAAFVRTVDHTI